MVRPLQKALFVFGTRPEAIKLAPLIRELRTPGSNFVVEVCVTGQHRDLLDQALGVFDPVLPNDRDPRGKACGPWRRECQRPLGRGAEGEENQWVGHDHTQLDRRIEGCEAGDQVGG